MGAGFGGNDPGETIPEVQLLCRAEWESEDASRFGLTTFYRSVSMSSIVLIAGMRGISFL